MKFFTVVAVLAVITSAVLAATTSKPASAAEETACQSHRKREMASSTRLPGRVIPECDANGNYMPKQCFSDVTTRKARWCGCWNANGDIITNPSTKTEECKCVIERDQKTKSKAADVPACEISGKYKKIQCSGESCKCVDPITGSAVKQSLTKEQATAQCQ